MSATARPNLGGLFNGSTPPERSSSIVDPLGPRLITSSPVVDQCDDSKSPESEVAHSVEPERAPEAGKPAAPSRGGAATGRRITDVPKRGTHAPTGQERRLTAPEWIDPVKAVEHSFALLQAVLDANREFAVGWANAVSSLPRRIGMRR
jgi:hypothetical protein